MKSILTILSFVLLVAFTLNAQTEVKRKCCSSDKDKTTQIEKSSSSDQTTLTETSTLSATSLSNDGENKKCGEECKDENCEICTKGKTESNETEENSDQG
jgi:hypothetical protein